MTNSHRPNRWVAGAMLMAAVLALAACGSKSGSNAGGSSTSSASTSAASSSSASSSAASSTNAPAASNDQRALEIFDAVVKGDFTTATANFDPDMKKAVPPDTLRDAWSKYQGEFGKYQSHGTPADVPLGDLRVVNVPLQMEKTPGLYRVTFHPDSTVAGLWFLTADAPMPPG